MSMVMSSVKNYGQIDFSYTKFAKFIPDAVYFSENEFIIRNSASASRLVIDDQFEM